MKYDLSVACMSIFASQCFSSMIISFFRLSYCPLMLHLNSAHHPFCFHFWCYVYAAQDSHHARIRQRQPQQFPDILPILNDVFVGIPQPAAKERPGELTPQTVCRRLSTAQGGSEYLKHLILNTIWIPTSIKTYVQTGCRESQGLREATKWKGGRTKERERERERQTDRQTDRQSTEDDGDKNMKTPR